MTENIWGVSTGQEVMLSAHNVCRLTQASHYRGKVHVSLFLVAKVNPLHWNHLLQKKKKKEREREKKNIFIFLRGFISSASPPLQRLCYLPTRRLSPHRQARQIKGNMLPSCVFFLNGYTCGTSGSKPDSLLAFFFFFFFFPFSPPLATAVCLTKKLLERMKKERERERERERESPGREHKGRAGESERGGREWASELSVVGLHPV